LSTSDPSGQNSVSESLQKQTITDCRVNKKRKDRYSVFLNGEFAFSIGEITYHLFPIIKGETLTPKQIEIILRHEEFEKAREQVLRLLSRRMRSEYELVVYLKRNKFDSATRRRVIAYCNEHGYLDDLEYARIFIRDKQNLNRYGFNKIRYLLAKRGISREIIESLADSQDRDEEFKIGLNLAQKRLTQIKDKIRIKEKLYRYLWQRGFDSSTIKKVLSKILSS
jgi:regulatory protein